MTTEAKVELSGQDRNLLPLIKEVAKGFAGIEELMGRVESKSKQTAKTSQDGFEKMISGAARAALSFAGIGSAAAAAGTAIRLATADYEHFNQQIERSRNAALNIAPAQTQAALSFTPDASAKSFDDIRRQVESISNDLKVPQATVYRLSSEALGDRGTLSNAQAMSAVPSALRLAPNLEAGDQANITKAMLGMMNTYGLSPEEAKGLILQGAAEHKVGLAEYSTHVAPAIKNMGNMGATLQEAFSLPSGMANAMGDKFGRESSTGSESLLSQVVEATERFPEMRGKGLMDRLNFLNSQDQRGIQARLGLTGVFDKDAIKYGRFEKGSLSMGQGAFASGISILNQQGEAWNQFRDAYSKAPDPATAAKFAASKEEEIGSLRIQKIARADLAAAKAIEDKQLEGDRAESGVEKKTFDQLLDEQVGIGPMDRFRARAAKWVRTSMMGMGEAEAGADVFRHMQEQTHLQVAASKGDETAKQILASLEKATQYLNETAQSMRGPQPNGPPMPVPGGK